MQNTNTHNRLNRSYQLLPYDPKWQLQFTEISKKLTPIFGDNLIRIDHIGSTAVPGMVAKPQIDVFITVKNLEIVKNLYEKMEAEGFKARGNFIQREDPEEYFTKDDAESKRLFSVHLMQIGNFHIEDTINFRDYLRSSPTARKLYTEHKLKLMEQHSDQDYNAYGKGKFQFLEDLKMKAREWDNAGRPSQAR